MDIILTQKIVLLIRMEYMYEIGTLMRLQLPTCMICFSVIDDTYVGGVGSVETVF